jgi:hypothetical protein
MIYRHTSNDYHITAEYVGLPTATKRCKYKQQPVDEGQIPSNFGAHFCS